MRVFNLHDPILGFYTREIPENTCVYNVSWGPSEPNFKFQSILVDLASNRQPELGWNHHTPSID